MTRMTTAEKLGAQITQAVRDFVSRSLAERDRRLDALEAQQVKTLADAYKGSYQPNNGYTRGDIVNHRSSLWLCMSATDEPPGAVANWRLILKSAR